MAQVVRPTIAPIFGPGSAPLLREEDAGRVRTEPKKSSNASSDRIEPQESTSRRTSVVSSRRVSETSSIDLDDEPSPLSATQNLRKSSDRLPSSIDSTEAAPVQEDETSLAGMIENQTRGSFSPASQAMRAEESASVRREPEISTEKIHLPNPTEFHGEGQTTRYLKSFGLRPRSMIGPETTSHPETINRMTTGRPLRSDLQGAVSERPIIRVTIGRIDVRAVPPPAPPQQPPPPPAPGLSLDDYLKERNGGER